MNVRRLLPAVATLLAVVLMLAVLWGVALFVFGSQVPQTLGGPTDANWYQCFDCPVVVTEK